MRMDPFIFLSHEKLHVEQLDQQHVGRHDQQHVEQLDQQLVVQQHLMAEHRLTN